MKKTFTKLMTIGAMLCAAPMFAQLLTPELLYYRFDGTGTTVPNEASAPPPGTTTATLMGGLTQGPGTTPLCSGSMIGSGVSSSTDYLNTGYAPNLTGTSWTISFRTANFTSSSTLFYIFGDANSGSFRCFTNGVAGPNNWILRGTGITDVFINGGAVVAPHISTYVYDQTTNTIYGYLDGVLVNTVAQTGPVIAGTGPFKVFGYGTNVGAPAGGQMDEFRLYSRALTAAEVAQLANPFVNPTTSFLGSDVNFCTTPSLDLHLNGWPFGSALWSTGSTNDTVSVTNTGTYYVDVTGNCGTGSDTITVGTLRTTASMNDIICGGNYVAPSGAVFTMPGTYMDTIPNAALCDSVITITLAQGPPTTSSMAATACDMYIAPSGAMFMSSGVYDDTIANSVGCDSIITITLTVLNSSGSTFSASACDMYIAPSGAMIMSSGTYMDTIPNAAGCDSVMTINVTITNSTSSTMSASACDMYTAPSGAMYMASGTYMDTITNMAGCDSIITINLTITNATTSTIAANACSMYTAPSGATYTASGMYMDTIANMAGCDSVITINLTIQNSTSSVSASSCGNYTAPSGAVYTTSGTYMDTITNAAGCDSVITIALTVTNVNAGATASNAVCTATGNTSGATFQWIDCSTMSPISGATSATYTATANGSYAVIITNNSCVDTSNCVTVNDVSVAENAFASDITLYPNPSAGEFNINLGATYDNVSVVITDLAGRTVFAKNENSTNMVAVDLDAPAGTYIVTVMSGENLATIRIVVE